MTAPIVPVYGTWRPSDLLKSHSPPGRACQVRHCRGRSLRGVAESEVMVGRKCSCGCSGSESLHLQRVWAWQGSCFFTTDAHGLETPIRRAHQPFFSSFAFVQDTDAPLAPSGRNVRHEVHPGSSV